MSIIKKTSIIFLKIITMISPVLNTKLLYRIKFRKKLDLKNPATLNEKILWLKLNRYSNNNLITQCADKFEVREYVKQKGLEHILNELYFCYDHYNQIDYSTFPNEFVLKLNHAAGYNLICRDKNKLSEYQLLKKVKKWFKSDFWKIRSELNYKNIKKKIIIEKLLLDSQGNLPLDYKVYCFHGKPYATMVCIDRHEDGIKFLYYDENWSIMPLSYDSIQNPNIKVEKPVNYDLMIEYARILSSDFPFVRVDFYYIKGAIFFGELTFTPSAGLDTGRLEKTDIFFGKKIKL